MTKAGSMDVDDLMPEYDFRGGQRGKYAQHDVRCSAMNEADYWLHLEYRICREFEGMRGTPFRFTWCDGLTPEEYLLGDPAPRIRGKAWICNGPRQAEWEFTLFLPLLPRSREEIDWSSLLPPENVTRWLAFDHRSRRIQIEPLAAVPDEEYAPDRRNRKETDIRNFELAWRWTQDVLPDAVLAALIPLDGAEAHQVNKRLRRSSVAGGYALNADLFSSVMTHDASGECSSFLASLNIDDETRVILSWDRTTALRTTWRIFKQYWDDFCYPSSDDVSITPEDDSWMLYYCHAESFEFGWRKKTDETL